MDAVSRRWLLKAAGTVPVAGLLGGCDPITTPPPSSPFLVGPYATGTLIIGEDAGTTGLPLPLTQRDIPVPVRDYNLTCVDGRVVERDLPSRVLAAAYYPRQERDHRVPEPNPFNVTKGPFPVLLYAHALRYQEAACATPYPIERDFAKMGAMLRHVASYGCVVIAPDLSWLPPDIPGGTTPAQAIELRAKVLIGYYMYLASLNSSVFAGQLDLKRLIMAGHSTGGGAAALAGNRIATMVDLQASAYGLIAPYFRDGNESTSISATTRNVVVMHGTKDNVPGWSAGYAAATGPKTLVTIPGANHFGYTDLCEYDNTCPQIDASGDIGRTGQQQTAAAYLAALLRLYIQGDETARPYLTGEQVVEGLDFWGVTGVQVQQSGVALSRVPDRKLE